MADGSTELEVVVVPGLSQLDDTGDEEEEDTISGVVWRPRALRSGDLDVVTEWINSLPREQLINKLSFGGQNALHVACANNQPKVAGLLLEAGADPTAKTIGVVQFEWTALHCACLADGDIDELVRKLLDKYPKCKIDVTDEDECTALHYAAMNGHTSTASLLLNNGAKLDAKDKSGDTPVHKAAEEGHVEVLEVMISHGDRRNTQCVSYTGQFNETPLHRAAAFGHTRAVEKLIQNGASAKVKNTSDETPLHQCITRTSGCQLAKLLLDAGADANARDCKNHGPLTEACQFGNTDVVILLMEYGAVVDSESLEIAVTEGYARTVVELFKCPQWPELLRHTIGETSTPFREMIRRMPGAADASDVAEEVLNKCTVANCSPNIDPGDAEYEVAFNYKFIEDFRDEEDDDGLKEVDKGRRKRKKTYGVSFSDVKYERKTGYTTKWGPVGFKKANHPLAIMVESRSLKLLNHPLVRSLLHHKWNKFGKIGYLFNLFTYSVFLLFLTIFALLVPNPQTSECMAITGSSELNGSSEAVSGSGMATTEISCSTSLAVRIVVYLSSFLVIVFALGHLLLQFFQLKIHRLGFIKDWINWMVVLLFLCSIIFVWIFNTRCQCPYTWQWQIGAIAIFLAWLNLIIFSAKFPLTGIYVLMFLNVFYTFLKTVTLAILLVVAFGLTFYMAFYEPAITRSPFSHPGRSLLRTMTMATGEFNFDSTFHQSPTGRGNSQEEIPFPPISYILWIVFVIVMPILLTNMLIGLATDEIQAIQKQAAVQKLALQVKLVLAIEEFLPKRLRRSFITGSKVVSPNRRETSLRGRKCNMFKELIWGGERYDTHSSLERALKPKQTPTEMILKEISAMKKTMGMGTDGATPTLMNTLLKEMSEMKKSMSQTQSQISQLQSQMETMLAIAKKQGIAIALKEKCT